MGGQAIREGVVWVRAVDWQRRLFDELVPIPRGTTDNAYLVRGREKTVFIDSVDPSCWDVLAGSLASLGVERLDHVVSNHAAQDHSGSLPQVLQGFPTATVLTTPKGKGCPRICCRFQRSG
jgi:flavorubredoxin